MAVHLAVVCGVYGSVFLCCPFSYEVLNLIESVSDGFPSYFCMVPTATGLLNKSEDK